MKELARTPSVNSELDFELAERLGKTLDDLDGISLSIVEDLRDALWKEWIADGVAKEFI